MGYKGNTPRNTLRKVSGIMKLTSQPLCLYRSECSSWWSIQTHYTTPTLACDPNKLMDAVVQPSGWIIIIFSQINSVNLQMKFKYTIGPCRWSAISVIAEKKPEKNQALPGFEPRPPWYWLDPYNQLSYQASCLEWGIFSRVLLSSGEICSKYVGWQSFTQYFTVRNVWDSLACYQSLRCLATVPPNHKEKLCAEESDKDISQSLNISAKSWTVGKQWNCWLPGIFVTYKNKALTVFCYVTPQDTVISCFK